jgi:hypothetical protein
LNGVAGAIGRSIELFPGALGRSLVEVASGQRRCCRKKYESKDS